MHHTAYLILSISLAISVCDKHSLEDPRPQILKCYLSKACVFDYIKRKMRTFDSSTLHRLCNVKYVRYISLTILLSLSKTTVAFLDSIEA